MTRITSRPEIETETNSLAIAKDYSHPVNLNDVERFISMVDDLGANKGAMISASGFTGAARTRAKKRAERQQADARKDETDMTRLITYSYKGNRVMPQKVTAVGIVSGDTFWMILGTGENQEAAKAAGDAVRSFTFR